MNDIADDQYGVYTPLISEMGLSAKKHPDSLTFDLLGDGFNKKCYDGVSFFSDKHPMGGTDKAVQSNMGNKKLNAESYAEARSQMMTVKGESHRSLNIVPDLPVVAPELSDYAEQWYLFCTKRYIKPFVFQKREKAKLVCKNKENDDNVFFDDEVIYGIKARYNVGFGLWQLAYGSTGTAEGTAKG